MIDLTYNERNRRCNLENREEIIEKNRNLYNQEQISFIAQNCIGGVIYHDMNKNFYLLQ